MPITIAPNDTVTFTVASVPSRSAQRKTIERLMRMQPGIQRSLLKRARKRRQVDNIAHQRGGRMWMVRVAATKMVRVEPGETFTIRIRPQIIPDLRSVERFLKAKK